MHHVGFYLYVHLMIIIIISIEIQRCPKLGFKDLIYNLKKNGNNLKEQGKERDHLVKRTI